MRRPLLLWDGELEETQRPKRQQQQVPLASKYQDQGGGGGGGGHVQGYGAKSMAQVVWTDGSSCRGSSISLVCHTCSESKRGWLASLQVIPQKPPPSNMRQL